tara:strand:+ start:128 stop:880 length:753 start_codon:yes stop_codon:yes gene_type:complete
MQQEILENIGLTKSEIATYLALLETGPSTTGPLIRKSKISSGKAYLILDKLLQKGLATYSIKAGTKTFQAKNPEHLFDYLKEKEQELVEKGEQLKKIIPELKQKYEEHKYKISTETYEGIKGFKTFYDWTLKELKKGDTIDILGVPREANEKFQAYLLEWNKQRIGLGIKLRIIYNCDSKEFGKKREKMRFTEVRYMKAELETPAWIDIFKDYVVNINVHGEPICFLIKNKETAESYKKYFDIIWKQSTP